MIILSMLGTSNYAATHYCWEMQSYETNIFSLALAQWYPEAVFKVLATDEAKMKHGDTILAGVPHAEFIAIPSGKTKAEFWQIFNAIEEALPPDEDVIVDITHGFRSLPTIALLALSFLRSAKRIKLRNLLYGAYEARNEQTGISPVFDLTEFVTMLDWANATDRFLDTGDARKIAPLIKVQAQYPLNDVATAMTELSNAIALMRASDIIDSARKLSRNIDAATAETWDVNHAPLHLLLQGIRTDFAPMAGYASAPDASAKASSIDIANMTILNAQWEQIRWLSGHSHYHAAASLAREWLVSVRVMLIGERIFPVNGAQRDGAEGWLNSREKQFNEEWKQTLELWRNLGGLRNDLMHFGMRESAKRATTIKKQAEQLPEQLRKAVKPLGLEVGRS